MLYALGVAHVAANGKIRQSREQHFVVEVLKRRTIAMPVDKEQRQAPRQKQTEVGA
ncbi:MAG: hypothetical protein K2P58_02975 [Hyphomonadaceae bacterium]|nr:hypothetical protein [Hyphomonadaceae bacterium]